MKNCENVVSAVAVAGAAEEVDDDDEEEDEEIEVDCGSVVGCSCWGWYDDPLSDRHCHGSF